MTAIPTLVPALDAAAIEQAIQRMAREFISRHSDFAKWVVAGIPTRGVEVARRLVAEIQKERGVAPDLGAVDISMHRDDLATRLR
ncbi:MAG TPA: hypothetical protein VIS74_04140, partial [Chthoniobacterales bacterium]